MRIELELPPTHKHLGVDGEVVYCEPNIGFGVRFHPLTSSSTRALAFTLDVLSGKQLILWTLRQEGRTAQARFRFLEPSDFELSITKPDNIFTDERFDKWDELISRANSLRVDLERAGWKMVPEAHGWEGIPGPPRRRRLVHLDLREDVAEWLLDKLTPAEDPQTGRVTARLAAALRDTQAPRPDGKKPGAPN